MVDDSAETSPADRIVARLRADAVAAARSELDAVRTAPANDRKAAMRALRTVAEGDPALVGQLSAPLVSFLEDDDRAVRLSAAKLLEDRRDGRDGRVRGLQPAVLTNRRSGTAV